MMKVAGHVIYLMLARLLYVFAVHGTALFMSKLASCLSVCLFKFLRHQPPTMFVDHRVLSVSLRTAFVLEPITC